MALQLAALFLVDERGRLTRRREPGLPPAPRFVLGRTRHGNVWRFREDLSSDCVRSLSRLAAREAPLAAGDDPSPPERLEPMRRLLVEDAPIERVWCGPAYRFPDDAAHHARLVEWSQGVTRIEPSDAAVFDAAIESFGHLATELDERLPCFGVVEDGRVISIAYAGAGVEGPATEVGVDTVSDRRGRGLAARCVAAWALDRARSGIKPLYSTSWTNRASRAVARKLGLRLIGEALHWT